MAWDDATPGNAATVILAPAREHIAGGYAPNVDQAATARQALATGLLSDAVTQGRPPGDPVDVNSPQQFPARPSLETLLAATAIGDDSAAEALPGRIFPGAWDGEPGWSAPGVDY